MGTAAAAAVAAADDDGEGSDYVDDGQVLFLGRMVLSASRGLRVQSDCSVEMPKLRSLQHVSNKTTV